MTLQQLRYLLAVADHGLNITTAANHLYTSQPGVSKQLRLLEEELGVQLFMRHGRSLVDITAAGRQAVVHARLIMREVEGIRSYARSERCKEGGERASPACNPNFKSEVKPELRVTTIRKRPF